MAPIKLIAGIIFCVAIFAETKAQVADASHPVFHSINNIGLLSGSENGSFQLQTIGGVGYKNWFGGIGAGIDYYRFRTIPIFVDLRHSFGKSRNKFFVYADGGTNVPWITSKQKKSYVASDRFSGRLYYDLGAGYNFAVGKTNAVLLSVGFSQLKLHERVENINYDLDIIPTPFNTGGFPYSTETYDYRLNRLTIKAGFVF